MCLGFITVFGFILFVNYDLVSCLSCSQCESLPGGPCMTSPPVATACESQNGDQGNINCMTAKHLDENGTLTYFSRGCTVVAVGDGCVPHNENITLCYQICHYDACNSAHSEQKWTCNIFVPLTASLLLYFCTP